MPYVLRLVTKSGRTMLIGPDHCPILAKAPFLSGIFHGIYVFDTPTAARKAKLAVEVSEFTNVFINQMISEWSIKEMTYHDLAENSKESTKGNG